MLTVPEVARLVQCHRSTVYRAISDGELEARRLGGNGAYRVERDAVDRWLSGTKMSRDQLVRLVAETDPLTMRRDVEIAPGTWSYAGTAPTAGRPLTDEERRAYDSVTREICIDAESILGLWRVLAMSRMEEIRARQRELLGV